MTGDDITCDFGGNDPEFEVIGTTCELYLDADTAFSGLCPFTLNLKKDIPYDNEEEITCAVTVLGGNTSFQGSVTGTLYNNQALNFL